MEQLNVSFLFTNDGKTHPKVNILSYKSYLFSTLSAFQKKIVLPISLMEQLNVSFLLANAAKSCRWVKHALAQKSFLSEFFEHFTKKRRNGHR